MRAFLAMLLFTFAGAAGAQGYVFAGPAASITEGERSRLYLLPGVGYALGRFAVEAAYFDPGEVSSAFRETAFAPGAVSATSTTRTLGGARLSLVGNVPLGESFALVAAVSAYRLKGEAREVDTVNGAPQAVRTRTVRDTVGGAGLGLSYVLAPSVRLRAMVDWMEFDGVRTRTPSLALLWRF